MCHEFDAATPVAQVQRYGDPVTLVVPRLILRALIVAADNEHGYWNEDRPAPWVPPQLRELGGAPCRAAPVVPAELRP
jgi:hypothetical protein